MGRETYRKIITSPEVIEKINPENIKLMERFLKNFATKHSPTSVVNYRSNLNILFCWNVLENDNMFFVNFKKYTFMDFFDYCVNELHWHSNRYCQCHSALSSFSTWIENMYDDKYPDFRNLLPKIEKPVKSTIRVKSVFTEDEMERLMQYLGDNHRIQEQCLLSLMIASGARASELGRFKTSIIDEQNTAFEGLFLETTEQMRVKGRGVDGKHIERYIIKDVFLPYYHKWLPVRDQIMRDTQQEHDVIFITKYGTPADVATFRGWVERWDNYTYKTFGKHFYLHMCRHYWCSYLLKIGLEKELVQDMQKWSSDSLVDLYNDNTAKDRKWKGLDKLKIALQQDKTIQES